MHIFDLLIVKGEYFLLLNRKMLLLRLIILYRTINKRILQQIYLIIVHCRCRSSVERRSETKSRSTGRPAAITEKFQTQELHLMGHELKYI